MTGYIRLACMCRESRGLRWHVCAERLAFVDLHVLSCTLKKKKVKVTLSIMPEEAVMAVSPWSQEILK